MTFFPKIDFKFIKKYEYRNFKITCTFIYIIWLMIENNMN